MPRYFFDVHNSDIEAMDDSGAELADLDAAQRQAIDGIRSILSDEVRHGKIDLRGRIDVRDEKGSIQLSVPYAQAVEVTLPEG